MTSLLEPDLDPHPARRSWRVRLSRLAALLRGTHDARIPF